MAAHPSLTDHISHIGNLGHWDIIKRGFNPADPNNLTPSEVIDQQLNATARRMIQKGLPKDIYTEVILIKSAKALWERWIKMNVDTNKLQQSKYEMPKMRCTCL